MHDEDKMSHPGKLNILDHKQMTEIQRSLEIRIAINFLISISLNSKLKINLSPSIQENVCKSKKNIVSV